MPATRPSTSSSRAEGGLVRLVRDDLADGDIALLDRLAGGDVADGHDDRTHLDGAIGGQAACLEGDEHGRAHDQGDDHPDRDVDLRSAAVLVGILHFHGTCAPSGLLAGS